MTTPFFLARARYFPSHNPSLTLSQCLGIFHFPHLIMASGRQVVGRQDSLRWLFFRRATTSCPKAPRRGTTACRLHGEPWNAAEGRQSIVTTGMTLPQAHRCLVFSSRLGSSDWYPAPIASLRLGRNLNLYSFIRLLLCDLSLSIVHRASCIVHRARGMVSTGCGSFHLSSAMVKTSL